MSVLPNQYRKRYCKHSDPTCDACAARRAESRMYHHVKYKQSQQKAPEVARPSDMKVYPWGTYLPGAPF